MSGMPAMVQFGGMLVMAVIMMEDDMQSDDGIGLGGRPKVFSALLLLARYDGDSCFEKS